jgi:hypothetical protein
MVQFAKPRKYYADRRYFAAGQYTALNANGTPVEPVPLGPVVPQVNLIVPSIRLSLDASLLNTIGTFADDGCDRFFVATCHAGATTAATSAAGAARRLAKQSIDGSVEQRQSNDGRRSVDAAGQARSGRLL